MEHASAIKEIIINFCPTGMVANKEMTPWVPVSPQEIIEQTHQAFELGITMVHLHARNDDQTPSHQSTIYQKIFEGIRMYCPGLVICGSSSGRNWQEFEKRSEVIELKPDMCSLTLSSMNFAKQASVNPPDVIVRLAQKMHQYGVVAELECFDLGMINFGLYLINKNIVPGPYYWNLLFGNISGFQATLSHMGTALSDIPDHHYVSLAGFGTHQLPVNAVAIAMGYGVRVGIEDNIWLDQKCTRLASNIELLHRIHRLVELHEASVMTAENFGKRGFYNRLNVQT